MGCPVVVAVVDVVVVDVVVVDVFVAAVVSSLVNQNCSQSSIEFSLFQTAPGKRLLKKI